MCRPISKEPAAGGPVTAWVWNPAALTQRCPGFSRGLGCCPRFSVGTLRVSETGRPGTAGRQGPQGHKEILLSCSTLGTCSFSGFREHEPRLCPLCWYKAPRTVPVEGNSHSLSSEPLRTKTKRLASPIRQIKGLFSSVFKKKKKKKECLVWFSGEKKKKSVSASQLCKLAEYGRTRKGLSDFTPTTQGGSPCVWTMIPCWETLLTLKEKASWKIREKYTCAPQRTLANSLGFMTEVSASRNKS